MSLSLPYADRRRWCLDRRREPRVHADRSAGTLGRHWWVDQSLGERMLVLVSNHTILESMSKTYHLP